MRASWRRRGQGDYQAVHVDDIASKLVWACQHRHATRAEANACARANLGAPTSPGPPAGLPKDRPVIRRSLAENVLSCVVWQPDHSSEAAAFGTVAHEAIQVYQQECRAAGEDSLLHRVRPIAVEAWQRVQRGLPPHRMEELASLLDYFSRTHLADLRTLWALEYTWVTDGGWAWLTGTVDRVDRMDDDDAFDPPRILQGTDYKTHWRRSGDHTFQGRWYGAQAMLAVPSLQEWWWVPDHVRSSYPPEPIKWTREYLLAWWEEMLAGLRRAWQQRRRGAPTGGSACEYCALRLSCAAALAPARNAPETEDQALELAGEWIRATARREELGAALKVYFDGHDPAVVDGLLVGFQGNPGWAINWPEGEGFDTTHLEPSHRAEWLATEVTRAGVNPLTIVTVGLNGNRVGKRLLRDLLEQGTVEVTPPKLQFRASKAIQAPQEANDPAAQEA